MEITACDNCGKQSPDEAGLHIANDWTVVYFSERRYRNQSYIGADEYIICHDCLPFKKNRTANKLAKFLRSFLKLEEK